MATESNQMIHVLINERLFRADKVLDAKLASDCITKAEYGLIREFLAHRVQYKKISASRAYVLATMLCSVREYKLCPEYGSISSEDVAGLFLAIESENSPYKQNTACSMDVIIRMFITYLADIKGYDINLKQIKAIKRPEADTDGIQPSDILSEAQFDELIRHCHTARDKAIMAIFADCGVRPEEIELLKWSDLEFTTENVRINVTDAKNKKKKKMNYCIDRAEYLRQWRSANEGDNPKSPVFRAFINARSIIQSDKALASRDVRNVAIAAYKSANIPFPAGYACRLLRTSNITNQLKARLSPVAIMKSHWSAGLNSKMWSHYERLAGIDTEEMFMSNSGRKVVDLRQKEVKETIICECGHINPSGRTECIRCHSDLTKRNSGSDDRMAALERELTQMKEFMALYMKNNPPK